MNNEDVKRLFITLKQRKVLLFFFVFALLIVIFFTLNYTFNASKEFLSITDTHPSLSIKSESQQFFQEQVVQDILNKHNIKQVKIILTNNDQQTFKNVFGGSSEVYSARSMDIKNDIFTITISLNSEYLRKIGWEKELLGIEASHLTYLSLLKLDNQTDESFFNDYIQAGGAVPFTIEYD